MENVTIEAIPILTGREGDGRWWADIELMPGVMAWAQRATPPLPQAGPWL